MKNSFLKKIRENKNLTIQDVAKRCRIEIKELKRIESGAITEEDMMILSRLADFYGIDYPSLLFLFKLARRPELHKIEKMAAYHDKKIDEKTQKELIDFVSKLKDSFE